MRRVTYSYFSQFISDDAVGHRVALLLRRRRGVRTVEALGG